MQSGSLTLSASPQCNAAQCYRLRRLPVEAGGVPMCAEADRSNVYSFSEFEYVFVACFEIFPKYVYMYIRRLEELRDALTYVTTD